MIARKWQWSAVLRLTWFYLFQQRIDPRGLLFDRVAHKVKRGSMPQIKRKAKLLAHVRSRMTQRQHGLLVLLFVAFDGHVNAGVAQIRGDPNFGDGDHAEARILHFVTDNLRDLFPQTLSNTLRTMHVRTA